MTIIKQRAQRIGLFIDTQNLYHSAKRLFDANVNFKKLIPDIIGERKLVRAFAYVITTESGEESTFFEALTNLGIETRTKDLQIFMDGVKKADWDVGLAVDAIRLSNKLDAVVIFSGDGDFIPLVEYLKFNSGCQVEVVAFEKTTSTKLIEVVDDFFDISLHNTKYLIKKKNRQRKKQLSTTNVSKIKVSKLKTNKVKIQKVPRKDIISKKKK